MENAKTLHALDEFAKTKPKDIPKELDDYLRYVAASGDPVYQWSLVKFLFRQKLLNVILEFLESCPMLDVPLTPNLDPFNFEIIKKRLLDRYDLFTGVPFTIQRIAELLTAPRKQYSRLDKYMRALEKNVWVVSTREPGIRESSEKINLVNGVLSSVLHSNNVENNQERLESQSEIFDGEEELGEKSELVEHVSSDENNSYETSAEPPPEISTEPVSTPESNEPTEVPNCRTEELEPDEEKEVKVDAEPAPNDPEPAIETKLEECTDKEDEEDKSETNSVIENADSEVMNAEKTEEITITEVIATEGTDSVEKPVEPAVVEPAEEFEKNESETIEPEVKVDLKRKIAEVIDHEEEEGSNKKLETEAKKETHQEKSEDKLNDVAEELPAVAVELAEDKIVEENVTEIVEVEGEMESTEEEEKVEMVVEEPEQAMDVDETSVQSPMAQEDVAEPMEASELVPS